MAFNKFPSAIVLFAMPLVAFAANVSQAQLYKWTDENGKVQYSDTVPPAAVDRARKEIRPDGMVKKEVDRAQTPEERRIAAQKAAAEAAERAVKEERLRKDKALLATYSSVGDFDRVRDRAVLLADGEIAALKKQEEAELAQRADLQKQVDAAKKGPSLKLKTDFENSERELQAVRALLDRKTKDRVSLVASFTNERARFLELMAAEKAALAGGATTPSATPAATAATPKKKP